MKIESKLYGDVAVLSLMGELDSRGHTQLDRILKELVESGVFKVVLDLSTIRFMGQQTISLLLSHMKELRANSGDVRFLNPQRALMQYLKQNRVIELFKVYSTRADALDSYKLPEISSAQEENFTAVNSVDAPPSPASDSKESTAPEGEPSPKSRFETGEILYANSCMLATLIKMLETKGMLSTDEAKGLMDYERLSLKGVDE